jgi:hypothetical protein
MSVGSRASLEAIDLPRFSFTQSYTIQTTFCVSFLQSTTAGPLLQYTVTVQYSTQGYTCSTFLFSHHMECLSDCSKLVRPCSWLMSQNVRSSPKCIVPNAPCSSACALVFDDKLISPDLSNSTFVHSPSRFKMLLFGVLGMLAIGVTGRADGCFRDAQVRVENKCALHRHRHRLDAASGTRFVCPHPHTSQTARGARHVVMKPQRKLPWSRLGRARWDQFSAALEQIALAVCLHTHTRTHARARAHTHTILD